MTTTTPQKLYIMNIRYTICMLATVFLTACSENDDVRKQTSPEVKELTREEMVSDVPINFAPVDLADIQWEVGNVAETRGGTVDAADFTMDNVGIFCLAKKKMPDGPMNPVWNGANKTYQKKHVWEDNAQVSIIGNGDGKGTIQWGKEFQLHYYPTEGWYTYGFVAYHPWTDCLKYDMRAITAYFKLDGNDDVIHAITGMPDKSFGVEEVDGLAFSKQYYDEIRTRQWDFEGTYPVMRFQRLTSRLDFYFCLDVAPTQNIHVDKVEFSAFPSVMSVQLASLDKNTGVMSANIGTKPYVQNQAKLNTLKINDTDLLLDVFPEMSPCFDHFELREEGETFLSGVKVGSDYKYNLTTDLQKVGDCILIPPVAYDHSKSNIQLFVTLCDDNGHKYKNVSAIEIKCPSTGWLMGKRYDVRITLNAPSGYGTSLAPSMSAASTSTETADGTILWQPKATVTVTPRK